MQLFIFILVVYSNQYRHVHVCFSKGDLVPFPVGHPDDPLSSLSMAICENLLLVGLLPPPTSKMCYLFSSTLVTHNI